MCELVVGWLHAVDKLIAQRRGGGGSGLNCSLGYKVTSSDQTESETAPAWTEYVLQLNAGLP